MSMESRIGLALGGGGARGMVHILVCEVFDELGIKPALIAGTSIGAIIGAGYAAGFSGKEMREAAVGFYAKRREVLARALAGAPARLHRSPARPLASRRNSTRASSSSRSSPASSTCRSGSRISKIPMKIIACDFYAWCEVILAEGELRPAIAASIAIPALFRPVNLDGRVLIDGGATNPLPFDHVADCEITVACDVAGGPAETPGRHPGLLECVVGAAQISMQSVIREKLKWHQPDVLLRPGDQRRLHPRLPEDAGDPRHECGFKDDLKRRLEHIINTPFELPLASAKGAKKAAKKGPRPRVSPIPE